MSSQQQSRLGFGFAFQLFSYGVLLPFFMKAVAHIDVLEVLAHRVIWSIPVALIVLLITRRTADIATVFKDRRKLLMMMLSAGFISVNWGTYVWAIGADRTIEAALGYYINPLISVAMGTLFLGEKMTACKS